MQRGSVLFAPLIHRSAAVGGEGYTKVERPPPSLPPPHLSHGGVDLQDLLVTFDLAHADLAGELGGGGAVSLQREGTVQRLLVAAPHLGEGELLVGGAEDRGENITKQKNILQEVGGTSE